MHSAKNVMKPLHRKHVQPEVDKLIVEVLFKNFPVSFYWMDTEGTLLGCNDRVLKDLHLNSLQDFVGKHSTEIASVGAWENSKSVMEAQRMQSVEEAHIKENGEKIYYLSIKSPVFDHTKKVIGLVGISIDITERKRAEEELKRAKEKAEEANYIKTAFLENMRHDIRTPLTGIVGFANLIKEETNDKKIERYAENLVTSSHALMDFLNEILESICVISGEAPILEQKFDLKTKLQHIIQLNQAVAKDKKISLELCYGKDIPHYLIGDGRRIYRIMLELVTNALKFTHEGGVKLLADLDSPIDNAEKNIVIKFRVSDTGIGIAKEQQEEIFTRFHRLTSASKGVYSGLGMGLAIVKQYLEELGASIHIESIEGKGSTFTCKIPFERASLDTDAILEEDFSIPYKKDAEPARTHYRILIVEDQPVAAQAVKGMLNTLSCETDIAADGKSAIGFFETNVYDLIFMDIGLPDIDGYEVTRQIRSKEKGVRKYIPIIALTAHVDTKNTHTCIASGMDAVLSKPLVKEKADYILSTFLRKQLTEN